MRATGWYGGSRLKKLYAIRISPSDRDAHFKRSWDSVTLELEGAGEVRVTVSDSFWSGCTELRSAQIDKWMRRHGFVDWPYREPPRFDLEPMGDAAFKLRPKK